MFQLVVCTIVQATVSPMPKARPGVDVWEAALETRRKRGLSMDILPRSMSPLTTSQGIGSTSRTRCLTLFYQACLFVLTLSSKVVCILLTRGYPVLMINGTVFCPSLWVLNLWKRKGYICHWLNWGCWSDSFWQESSCRRIYAQELYRKLQY